MLLFLCLVISRWAQRNFNATANSNKETMP